MGELMMRRSEQSRASGVSTKGHMEVHSLTGVSWGLAERCEGGMAETLRGSDMAVRPWRRLWTSSTTQFFLLGSLTG